MTRSTAARSAGASLPPADAVRPETERVGGEPGRLAGIDALRGVGALLVLAHHGFWGHLSQELWARGGIFWAALPFLQGFVGVHLFLVVSGFCIHARAARQDPSRSPDFVPFWRRRLRRLYPPYLAAVVLSLVLLAVRVVLEARGEGRALDAAGIWERMAPGGVGQFSLVALVHLLMLFPFYPVAPLIFHNPVFWTLALEEQLYAMYFLLPWLRRRFGLARCVLGILGVTLLWRALAVAGPLGYGVPTLAGPVADHVGTLGPGPAVAWLTVGPARWFEWILGAVAVERAFGRIPDRPIYTSIPAALLACAAAMATQWSHAGWIFTDALWGAAFFVLVNRVVDAERAGRFKRWRWAAGLSLTGVFSYSLYLVHEPLLRVIQPLLLQVAPWQVALPAGMVLVLPIAWVFYRCFELPAIRWARRRPAR